MNFEYSFIKFCQIKNIKLYFDVKFYSMAFDIGKSITHF